MFQEHLSFWEMYWLVQRDTQFSKSLSVTCLYLSLLEKFSTLENTKYEYEYECSVITFVRKCKYVWIYLVHLISPISNLLTIGTWMNSVLEKIVQKCFSPRNSQNLLNCEHFFRNTMQGEVTNCCANLSRQYKMKEI